MINYCKKYNIKVFFTAHTLEDQVETFFIRLSRGSGLKGLSAMQQVYKINSQVSLYRPLLNVKKKFLIKISKNIFGKYFKDPSNKNQRYLRTKVRSLKKPLEKSGIQYDQIFKSIQNLSSSKSTLEDYLNNISKNLIKEKNREIFIDLKKFKKQNDEIKLSIINQSIKKLKSNYYDIRSKKLVNLIKHLDKNDFKKSTLGGCIFLKKDGNLLLKIEKS